MPFRRAALLGGGRMAGRKLVPERGLLLTLGAQSQAFISFMFWGHSQIIFGISTQTDPYSPVCELCHAGPSTWKGLLNQAYLPGVYFCTGDNQSPCPRGQREKERTTSCQMKCSTFPKSNTGSSLGTQELMTVLPCVTCRLLHSEKSLK